MNYIYDVLANFSNIPYDFFEWNKGDNVYHLKKTPIIKIESDVLFHLLYHKVKVDVSFLNKIKDNTEFYGKEEQPNYICLVTDGKTNACIRFNNLGMNINKSYLPNEEDEEALEISERLSKVEIKYEILNNQYTPTFKTRKEIQMNQYILKNMKILDQKNDIDKLIYIYYDCFDEKESNKKIIISRIYKELMNNNFIICEKLYNFFRLLSIKSN